MWLGSAQNWEAAPVESRTINRSNPGGFAARVWLIYRHGFIRRGCPFDSGSHPSLRLGWVPESHGQPTTRKIPFFRISHLTSAIYRQSTSFITPFTLFSSHHYWSPAASLLISSFHFHSRTALKCGTFAHKISIELATYHSRDPIMSEKFLCFRFNPYYRFNSYYIYNKLSIINNYYILNHITYSIIITYIMNIP